MISGPALALLALGWAGAAGAASPDPASEHRRAALERFQAGDFEGAYARIMSALAAAPYDPETLRLRLRIEVLGGSRMARWIALSDAERRARQAGTADAARAEALVESAWLRLQLGDAPGAERHCLDALRLKPGDAEASYRLAEALRDRPERALPHADRAAAAARTPRREAAARRLAGEIRLDLGDLTAARASLERALAIDADDLDALRAMVRVLAARPKKARVFALRAARAAEAAPLWYRAAALRFSAHIWLELKEYGEAEAGFARALAFDPDDLGALESLVLVKNENPRRGAKGPPTAASGPPLEPPVLESADAAARFADEIAGLPYWRHADAYRLLARTWLALGDRQKAYKHIRYAEEVEVGSVRTARIQVEIAPDGEDAARDLREALHSAAQARAELGSL